MHQFTGYYWKDCKGSTIQSRSLVKTVHWYEQRAKKNSKKSISKKIFSSWWVMQCLKKLWKSWENIEISSLLQPNEEGAI